MIGVVVSNQQSLSQQRLALATGYCGKQIRARIGNQVLHRFQVSLKRCDALIPGVLGRWRIAVGPISAGKLGGDMIWITAEFEDVPLRDPHVLQQPPRSMGDAFRLPSAEFNWEVGN